MSDLGHAGKLARSSAQLPVSAYFDEALHARERERLFRDAPHYVGHALMVPERGDFHTLSQERDGRMLVRTARAGRAVVGRRVRASRCCRTCAGIARPSSATAAATPAQHRLPAASLDLRSRRSNCSARRTSRTTLAWTSARARCRTGTASCSSAARRSRPSSPGAPAGTRLRRLRVRSRRGARVRVQLEDVHRGLPRGLPRRTVPSRASASSCRATTCLGNTAEPLRCRWSASRAGCSDPAPRPIGRGTTR